MIPPSYRHRNVPSSVPLNSTVRIRKGLEGKQSVDLILKFTALYVRRRYTTHSAAELLPSRRRHPLHPLPQRQLLAARLARGGRRCPLRRMPRRSASDGRRRPRQVYWLRRASAGWLQRRAGWFQRRAGWPQRTSSPRPRIAAGDPTAGPQVGCRALLAAAQAGHRRFEMSSALFTHPSASHKSDSLRDALRPLNRPSARRARTAAGGARPRRGRPAARPAPGPAQAGPLPAAGAPASTAAWPRAITSFPRRPLLFTSASRITLNVIHIK